MHRLSTDRSLNPWHLNLCSNPLFTQPSIAYGAWLKYSGWRLGISSSSAFHVLITRVRWQVHWEDVKLLFQPLTHCLSGMWLIYTSLTLGLWLPSAAYLGSESEHINQAITYPGHKTLCSLILLFSKENELKSGQSHQLIPNKSSECSRSHPACKYIVIWK